uniref:UDP-GalNAc:beta-1, 3-N-acetylgalactosaminyltransferase 2-like n=1 Tax=Styela clava TaxID=7725 RepID=UPI00193A8DA2|nr:UDP-GalNAc:beta-1,3-N-acetylgalactosaminyltransferase 2-like [Styela clava]
MRSSNAALFVFIVSTAILSIFIRPALKWSKLHKYKLAIGILSARENFVQRDTIRSTWLSIVSNTELFNDIFVKFILANQDCNIPVEYRNDAYTCEEARKSLPEQKGPIDILHYAFVDNKNVESYSADFVTVGYDFVVAFDVILSGITISITNGQNVVVQLWNLAADSLVVEARDPHRDNTSNIYIYGFHPHLLPKGFLGSLVVVCDRQKSCVGVKSWFQKHSFHPAIKISPIIRYSLKKGDFPIHILPVTLENMILPASLIIEFADITQLRKYVQNGEYAYSEKQQHIFETDKKIKQEIQEHDDILIVSDIDGADIKETYRNVPRKLVSFHQYVARSLNADFIMKTDDDSYVDIEKIYKLVKQIEEEPRYGLGIWLGNFRRDWIVDRWGKWAEYQYTASVYPAYACGAGNIISSNISKYLAINSRNLKFYQGEDVSMGIWMSALDVEYIQNDQWLCDDSCFPNMMVSTQHTTYDLKRFWENKNKCGNPCECL